MTGSGARPAAAAPVGEDAAADAQLLAEVLAHYRRRLVESPEALGYLERRGLSHPELVERFQLGYADRTLCYALDERADRKEARARLQRLGVLRSSGHEHLAGSLVVPVFDAGGAVVELYGRKVRDDLRKGTPAHLYLPGPHRGVWNREGLIGAGEVILCEAALDALTFWVAGFQNVTWSFGVQGFTSEHLDCFRELGTRRVLIAYDADRAGDAAAGALAATLAEAGIGSARVHFPRGLDANAYALQVPPAARSLAVLLEQATPLHETGAEPVSVVPEATFPSLAALPQAAPAPEPVSPPSPPAPDVEIRPEEVVVSLGERSYRVRGFSKNSTPDALRINLMVRYGELLHVDTLDLYSAKQRGVFAGMVARELGCKEEQVRRDLGTVLLRLEDVQAEALRAAAEREPAAPTMSEAETEAALELLRSPDLLGRIAEDFRRSGVVGEETNTQVGYLAAVSRKLERPLAVIVQSASAAGKTSLMDAVLAFVPPEEKVQYSALTGQSLFYMEGADLRHKVLAVVEEEGAEKASYALKLLQSEGELTIASTGKDPQSGRLVTQEYRVEGPTMIFLTTTATDVDEELLNRALVLSVDEDRAQTRAIHQVQRERRTLEGLLAREERSDVVRLHRNAQRLLRPLSVVNPHAPRLTFRDHRTRMRRDHEKYLTLIDSIALLHQHQREIKHIERGGRVVEYVEVELSDIEAAHRLADAVLGRSLDELPPQSRRFLDALHGWVRAQAPPAEQDAAGASEPEPFRFTAREVRDALGTGVSQTKLHLARLVELEYVVLCRSGPLTAYELLYAGEGSDGQSFVAGLIDPAALRAGYDRDRPGVPRERPGLGRPLSGVGPGGGRGAEDTLKPHTGSGLAPHRPEPAEITYAEPKKNGRRRSVPVSASAAEGRA